jgi:hypothetical protein
VIGGLWPTPIADVAAAVVGALVVGLLRAHYKLSDRVARLEGRLESLNGRVESLDRDE